MITTDAETDISQHEHFENLVRCPECGQVLMDVHLADGLSVLRLKCRRCKRFIIVDIIGKK